MLPVPEINDLLALRTMPELAAALRERQARVVELWAAAVKRHLPDADPLTITQVRDSIPMVLEKIAAALESDRPDATAVLMEVGTAHGVARFQEEYDIEELIIEYRLLRRVILEELHAAGAGPHITVAHAIAVDMGIDIALQRGVTSYVTRLAQQLRSAAEAEAKYLSYLSHDVRNNLNASTLMLESLEASLADQPQFAEAMEDLRHLRSAVFETVDGMDRLLQAERLRKQAVALKLGPVDLHRLATDLIAQAGAKAAEKGLALEAAVPVEAATYSDRELIILALQNLLGNAIKFSARGTIRVEARPTPQGWRIAVVDQGPGIAPERVGTLFQAFRRGETHGQEGVGLGLTIASHAARLLGAELHVESQVGRGSTFSFVLSPADAQATP